MANWYLSRKKNYHNPSKFFKILILTGKQSSLSMLSLSAPVAHIPSTRSLHLSPTHHQYQHYNNHQQSSPKRHCHQHSSPWTRKKLSRGDALTQEETETLLKSDTFQQLPPSPQQLHSSAESFSDSVTPLLSRSYHHLLSPSSTPASSPIRDKQSYAKSHPYYYSASLGGHHHPPLSQHRQPPPNAKTRLKNLLRKAKSAQHHHHPHQYHGNHQKDPREKHPHDKCVSSSGSSKTHQIMDSVSISNQDLRGVDQFVQPQNISNISSRDYPLLAQKDLPYSVSMPTVVVCASSPIENRTTVNSQQQESGSKTNTIGMQTFRDNSTVNSTVNGYIDVSSTDCTQLDNRPLDRNATANQQTDEENNVKAKIAGLSIDSDISFIDGD